MQTVDWGIMSRPAKGFRSKYTGVEVINCAPFFSIYIKEENGMKGIHCSEGDDVDATSGEWGALPVKTTLEVGEEKGNRFFVTWNFPNRFVKFNL